MGNKNNGLALFDQIPHRLHEVINFLRRQYSGGLIKNQNIIVPITFLEFPPAAAYPRHLTGQNIKIHPQPIPFGQFFQAAPGLL